MKFGDPITTEQAVWAILAEIRSPVVGDLRAYSETYSALDYCMKDEVFDCLSSGEKRLVKIALGVHTANENGNGAGIASLGALDHTLRRKVWLILGYLYLGRDVDRDWAGLGSGVPVAEGRCVVKTQPAGYAVVHDHPTKCCPPSKPGWRERRRRKLGHGSIVECTTDGRRWMLAHWLYGDADGWEWREVTR